MNENEIDKLRQRLKESEEENNEWADVMAKSKNIVEENTHLQTRLKEAEGLLRRCEEIITDAPAFSTEEQDHLSQVLEEIEAFRDREKPE